MQFTKLAVVLALGAFAAALTLPLGANDALVLTIGVTGLATYQAVAAALNAALSGALSPVATGIESAVGSINSALSSTTSQLAALGSDEVGAAKGEIAAAYTALIKTILQVSEAAEGVNGFLTQYGSELDSELTAMVKAVDTAAHGTVAAIAADGAELKAYLEQIKVFYNLKAEIFSSGSL